jgi:hypothetical protein
MGWAAAAAIAGSAVLGAGTSLYGSSQAASSAKAAANLQRQQFDETRGDLSAYFTPGREAYGNALSLAESNPFGSGPDYIGQAADWTTQAGQNIPGQMTQQQLEQTPGYQFTLDQGLKATQSAMAARGLGASGAALKGAAAYATGLANKTYQDQFAIQQQRFADISGLGANYLNLNTARQGNLTNAFNRYNSLATIGENAAATSGAQGTQMAATAGSYLNQAGLAQAAGAQGVNSALTGAANNYLAYNAYNQRTQAQALQNPQLTGYSDPTTGFNNQPGYALA